MDSDRADDHLTLAEWKLVAPRARPGVVFRPRLFAALDRRARTALTLVTAPAGSGKTELVASWLESRPQQSVAWLSLDGRDADPLRFWTHLAHAVDRVRAGMARPALARLRTPGASFEEAIDELMNGIATFAGQLVIVIDDLHHFASGSQATSLRYAVDHLPERARIIATTRADPVVRFGRLRARGSVAEVRGDELAFTLGEARQLVVEQLGVALGDDDLAALVERTAGWPAGIGLAGLWLSEVDDPSVEVRTFSGDHRQVVDYLTDEVLDAVDEVTRTFMVRTSVLDRLCGSLCDLLLETTGSTERLDSLSRANLFLLPLDRRGEWYRYHPLFRDLLRLELSRSDVATVAALHSRAADWLAGRGFLEEALEHTASTGNAEAVASLLSRTYVELVRAGRSETFTTWLEWLPDPQLRAHPDLASAGALASVLIGRPVDERARLLRVAESAPAPTPEVQRRVAALSWLARSVTLDCDLHEGIERARRAVELAREEGDELTVPALATHAYALYLRGDLEAAAETAGEALARTEAPQRPHGVVYAAACGALVDVDLGRVRAGELKAARALDVARRVGLAAAWSAGLARVAMGHVLLAAGRTAEAERHLERAEPMRRAAQPTLEHAHALLLLARARVARGRLPLAASELDAALEELGAFTDVGRLATLAEEVGQELAEALRGAARRTEPPSAAELSILRLLATELSQREIAHELFLSLNTVKTHSRNLYRKLGVNTRESAVRRATEVGLLEPARSPRSTASAASPG